MRSRILGSGHYLPDVVLTNQWIEQLVETSDAWIRERTGIVSRRIARPGQYTVDLAFEAAVRALEAAKTSPEEIDLIIFATNTGDYVMPASACLLQARLNARKAAAFDLGGACSGFVYSLVVADQFIRTGSYRRILVVGAEVIHPYINYQDRETCILFGDGAGAVVVGPTPEGDRGLLSFELRAEGFSSDLFVLPSGGSRSPCRLSVVEQNSMFVRMKGREIFKFAVRTMEEIARQVVDKAGISLNDVAWVVPHQANQRIMDAVAQALGVPSERFISTVAFTGNTSAASIPIALDVAIRDGRIRSGDYVILVAFGAGLLAGGCLLRM